MFTTFILVVAAQAAAGAPAPTPPKPDAEKRICRSETIETGSIMPGKRICHTKAEWAAIAEQNEKGVERYRNEKSREFRGN
jgi:hypothetical protein